MKVTSVVLTLSALAAVAVATTPVPSQGSQGVVHKGPGHEGEPHGHGNVTHHPHGRPGGKRGKREQPRKPGKDEHLEKPGKGKKPEKPGKGEKPEKPGKGEQPKPGKGEKPEEPGKGEQPEKPGKGEQPEQPISTPK
ncbi:MAG: hypothetical protein J3Q66DRAFT_373072 [Benniella sp.]|nr:MAG: hypothetical protein J3Q66DRAFT_373072 [Benniella sp.]